MALLFDFQLNMLLHWLAAHGCCFIGVRCSVVNISYSITSALIIISLSSYVGNENIDIRAI